MKIPCLKTLLIPRIRTLLKLVQGGLVIGFKGSYRTQLEKETAGRGEQGAGAESGKSWK